MDSKEEGLEHSLYSWLVRCTGETRLVAGRRVGAEQGRLFKTEPLSCGI